VVVVAVAGRAEVGASSKAAVVAGLWRGAVAVVAGVVAADLFEAELSPSSRAGAARVVVGVAVAVVVVVAVVGGAVGVGAASGAT
jgi:hypothetical protein